MLRQCIEVVRLRRVGEFYVRNLSGTASDNDLHPSQSNECALRRFFYTFRLKQETARRFYIYSLTKGENKI